MKTIQPKFLRNIPTGEDLFEGKSQEKVALEISSIINSEKFQIIGVDGGWGTGKSNMVKIVENQLKDSHKFFIYDVWGHQEDEQRKAILVELTEFLTNRKNRLITKKKKWDEKLKRILSKEKEVTVINRPYLSPGFIFTLISVVYVPVVTSYKDTVIEWFNIESNIWKLILVFFPLLVLPIIYFLNVVRNFKFRAIGKSFVIALQDTFKIYNDKQTEETKTETIFENEPSVKDFRDWMDEIDKDLGTRQVVIVFDNFDRLPKKHIQSIWSSVHVFFAEKKYNNIKVIIPFDRDHIKIAFKDLNGESDSDYASDYINKTFDIVYRVSPPILSNWKEFFERKWKEAFFQVDALEYTSVIQIYDFYNREITPRKIITFINEVVSISRLQKNIPHRYISIFILKKDKILNEPLKAIIELTFLESLEYKYKSDANFQKYITALVYQLEPDTAFDVVYHKQIKDCLINNKSREFISLAKTNVFNKLISSIIAELENFKNPILVLDHLNEESSLNKTEETEIWKDIFHKISSSSIDELPFDIIYSIMFVRLPADYKPKWALYLIEQLNNIKSFELKEYIDFIDKLNESIETHQIDFNLQENLIQREVGFIMFKDLVEDKKTKYTVYKLNVDKDDFNKQIDDLINDSLFDQLDFFGYLSDDLKSSGIYSKLKSQIPSEANNLKNVKLIIDILKTFKEKYLGIQFDDSQIYSLYRQKELGEFEYDLIAMRLAKGNQFSSIYESDFNLEERGDSEVIEISSRILHYIHFGKFLILSSKLYNKWPIYSQISKTIILKDQGISKKLDTDNVLEYFEEICLMTSINPKDFIEELDRINSENVGEEVLWDVTVEFYEGALNSSTRLAVNSLQTIVDSASSFTKDDWFEMYNDLEGNRFQILKTIKFRKWTSHSLEALEELILLKMKNSEEFDDFERFKELIQLLENSGKSLKKMFMNIRDLFISQNNMTENYFRHLGYCLIKHGELRKKSDDVFRTIFINDLLDNNECIEILIRGSKTILDMKEKATEDIFNHFKEGIIDRVENEQIKKLADELKLKF